MNPERFASNLCQAMADLPYISADLTGIGGIIKAQPSHFQVEEILPYQPCGEGEHLYATVRRQGWNTADVARALAEAFGLKNRDVGYGGRKDKQAVATQTFSLPLPMAMADDKIRARLMGLPFEILDVSRHRNKIKTGHVAGNRFKILLTQVETDALPAAHAIGNVLMDRGIPNYYGPQRFGHDMRNLQKAAALVSRGRPARGKREQFLVSALQSALFNIWLKERIARQGLGTILDGDWVKKTDTGGMFLVEDLRDAEQRLACKQIVYTGPIFGYKMRSAGGRAGELEHYILNRLELDASVFKTLRAAGSRRPAVLLLDELDIQPAVDGLAFNFRLPSGAYATTVLREFIRPPGGRIASPAPSQKAATP